MTDVGVLELSIQNMIQKLRIPSNWQHARQWLIFWTAMAASAGVRRAGTVNDGEDVCTSSWVEKWKNQTSSWPDIIKNGFKCDPAFIYGSMLDTKGESESGADVMLAFCFYTGSSYIIRFVYIQFKRTSPSNRVSAIKIVHAEKFDQYKRVASWHEPKYGVTAIYGKFSSQLDILETISAIDVIAVKHAINKKIGSPPEASHESWRLGDGAVNWTENAESMPSALAKALSPTGDETAGFTSLDAAVVWLDSKLGEGNSTSVQPKYWVIQAMGDHDIALDKTKNNPKDAFYQRVRELATKYGYQQSQSHEHGHVSRMTR